MYQFNKKQKIIIVVILSVIIIAFLYYIYAKDKSTFVPSEELEVENITEKETEETKEEESQKIIVHVSGEVNKEGIVELEVGSRISDAIDKAEGLAENADTKEINLAFKLEDGMKIYIPKIGEEKSEEVQESTSDETSKYITSTSGVVDSQDENTENNNGKSITGKVNINTASQTELETLPGIGPATSSKIISYREENGKFESIEELKEVSGIGDAKFENIKELICVK